MRALAVCATVVMLAGCARSPSSATGGAIPQTLPAEAPRSAGSYVYVAQCCGVLNSGDVTVYEPGLTGIVRHIVAKQFNPIVIALDSAGTLYVLDQSAGYAGGISVTEYDYGSTRPSRKIAGLYWGVTIALDGSNDLYVANCNTCVDTDDTAPEKQLDSIAVYGPKATTPMRTITQGVHVPESIALDAAGTLYVANSGTGKSAHPPSLTAYSPGSTSLLRTVKKGITRPGPLATDGAGNVFLANGSSEVIEFAPQLSNVLRKITDAIASPQALTTDDSGTLYVANTDQYPSKGRVSVYSAGSSSAEYEIVKDVDQPVALRVDNAGDLYVANDNWDLPGHPGWIGEYPPNARKPIGLTKTRRYGNTTSLGLGRQ